MFLESADGSMLDALENGDTVNQGSLDPNYRPAETSDGVVVVVGGPELGENVGTHSTASSPVPARHASKAKRRPGVLNDDSESEAASDDAGAQFVINEGRKE